MVEMLVTPSSKKSLRIMSSVSENSGDGNSLVCYQHKVSACVFSTRCWLEVGAFPTKP